MLFGSVAFDVLFQKRVKPFCFAKMIGPFSLWWGAKNQGAKSVVENIEEAKCVEAIVRGVKRTIG